MKKQYLGDGVYADFNVHGQVVLTTENGIETTNTIIIEMEVWEALRNYVNRIVQETAKPKQ